MNTELEIQKEKQKQYQSLIAQFRQKKVGNNMERTEKEGQISVLNYLDYREFLQAALNHIKSKNPNYSESAFIQAAGFGKNSRGYFGLIVKGKRNLKNTSILGFAKALKLNTQDTMFFENLVYFNQAKTEDEKKLYFERMKVILGEKKTPMFEVLESHHNYLSQWYMVVLRELVALDDFQDDDNWIIKKLNKKITKTQARQGIEDLKRIGLLSMDSQGKLVQSELVLTFSDNKKNFKSANELHKQFLDMAKDKLENDPYDKRSLRLTTLSCAQDDFEMLREEMREFSRTMIDKYAVSSKDKSTDVVLQLGMQLFYITE